MSATLGCLSGSFMGAFLFYLGGFIMPILFLGISLIISLILAFIYFENEKEESNNDEIDVDFN